MSKISKYTAAYGQQFKNEMLWDVALRKVGSGEGWTVIPNSSKRYWMADPFLYHHNREMYLFYERYDRLREIGEIAFRPINEDLSVGAEKCIIRQPYHLSFPCIFEYKENIYIIPESMEKKSIELYRAVSFPHRWELEHVICTNKSAVDTIVYSLWDEGLVLLTSIIERDACSVTDYKLVLNDKFAEKNCCLYKEASEYGNRNAGAILYSNGDTFRMERIVGMANTIRACEVPNNG